MGLRVWKKKIQFVAWFHWNENKNLWHIQNTETDIWNISISKPINKSKMLKSSHDNVMYSNALVFWSFCATTEKNQNDSTVKKSTVISYMYILFLCKSKREKKKKKFLFKIKKKKKKWQQQQLKYTQENFFHSFSLWFSCEMAAHCFIYIYSL